MLGAEDDFSELVDPNIPRVDLVGKAANGVHRFLIAKSADGPQGMIEADMVRALVAKADMSGKKTNDLPDSDFAYIEPGGKKDDEGKTVPRSLRHFPIPDAAHVRNALSRAPQSPFGDKAMPAITAAAKKFNIEVSKAGSMDLDASTIAVGEDDNIPGSEGWEQVDSDTASKWVAILARAKQAVEFLCSRESLEIMSGAEDGTDGDTWNLEQASCAIDAAIGYLAPFAVTEQAEADCISEGGDGVLAVMKAAVALADDPFPLTTIESLGSILKAGRVLSTANESKIRDAAASLQQVLASLPTAPEGSDMDNVTKGTTDGVAAAPEQKEIDADAYSGKGSTHIPVDNKAETAADNTVAVPNDVQTLAGLSDSPGDIVGKDAGTGAPVEDVNDGPLAEGVQKAGANDGKMQAVYDSTGKLLGTVDPSKITLLIEEGSSDAAGDDGTADGDGADDGSAQTPVTDPNAGAAAGDLTPAPPGAVGTPASSDGVAKADIESIVKATLAEAEAKNAAVVKALQDQIDFLKAPAPSRVLSNGALPPAHMLRGMDAGGTVASVAKAEELQQQRDTATDVVKRMGIENEMQEQAALAFEELRRTQRMAPGII